MTTLEPFLVRMEQPSKGVVHPLNHQSDIIHDIKQTHAKMVKAIDGGKMDMFAQYQMVNGVKTDEADSQFYQSDIPNYWNYAQTFTLADKLFSPVTGPSFPNQLFLIAAQNGDAVENPLTSRGGIPSAYGCDSPTGTTVQELHPNGSPSYQFPCFDFQTMGDTLNANNISWKFYAPGKGVDGYVWSSYDAINHIRNTSQWKHHVVDYSQFASDAASGNLPAVSWLTEPKELSDHPPKSVCAGENWTVSQMNAVMQNPTLWSNTAIILLWDDWGGLL